MDVACEECGDVGVKDLLLHCSNCKSASRHRYCLDAVIYDLSIVEWWCNGCLPKHNESVKSLEGISNQMQTNTQLDSSIINESNVKKEKVTNGLWSWGHHRNRSRKGRKDRSNASKHLLSGDTFNWEYLINRSHKARRDSSDACPKQLRSGEALSCCEMFIGETSKRNGSEKKGEDQNEHLIGALESVDGSSESTLDHASGTEEHTNFQNPMGGFKSTLNSTEFLDLLKEKHSCSLKYVDGSIPQRRNGYLVSLINDAERSPLMIGDKSCPTLASAEQADGSSPILSIAEAERFNALKVVNGLVCKQKGVLASKFPSKHSNPMQGSDLKTGNADVLNPSKGCLDSWSKVAESSLPSNEREDLTVEENSTETKCLADEEIVTPTLENCRGSNPSMSRGCLVSNEGNSDEADRRSDEHLSNTKDKRMRRHMSGEVHCDDPSERGNSCKVNEISNPKSAEGDQDGNNLKCNAGRTSSPAGKKVARKQALQVEGVNINSESLSSKYVSPCESTKINPRSRHQSNSYTPHETKYQKAKLIKKHESVNASRSKSGTPAVSLKDNENMPGKGNHSNGKVIESSKLGEDNKMDKSWLANKTSSDLRKRGIVTNVLQPSSLHKSSVDKSRPLNNRRNSCARRVTEVDQIRLSRKFDPTNSGALLEACSKTKVVHEANDTEPKKRRRLILPYDEDEDVEVMQVEDLNPRSCDNDARVKKQKRYMENGVKNQRRYVEKSDETLKPGNLNRRSSKYHKQVKKQRSIKRNEDENAGVGKLNAGCAQNDVSQFALQTAAEDNCGLSRRPLISEYICVQPVDKPYWTGIMKIGGDYIPLAAHLSTKAGKRVHEFSRSLPPIIKVTEHSTSKSCPKYLEALKPTVDNINLYFFSGDMRPNKELDQIVKRVAGHGIVLEAVVGLAKLLLFPSVALPDEYQMFQGKRYLLGVFQPRKAKRKILAPVEQDCTAQVTEEKQIQEQHVLDQPDQTSSHDTMDQEMPLANQVMHSENQPLPLLDANGGLGKESVSGNGPSSDMKDLVSANVSSADHGRPCSDSEVPPLKLCGFVVSRTQRSAQLIQEMQKEGALLFAVPQVLTEPVSLA